MDAGNLLVSHSLTITHWTWTLNFNFDVLYEKKVEVSSEEDNQPSNPNTGFDDLMYLYFGDVQVIDDYLKMIQKKSLKLRSISENQLNQEVVKVQQKD